MTAYVLNFINKKGKEKEKLLKNSDIFLSNITEINQANISTPQIEQFSKFFPNDSYTQSVCHIYI